MAEDKFDTIVYKNKTFGKLLEEIHTNSRDNDKLIAGLIQDFKDNVEIDGLGDVIMLAKVLEPYIKMSIDNNDHIIKMASIVQKSLEKPKSSEDEGLSGFTEQDRREMEQLALEAGESLKLTEGIVAKAELPEPVKKVKRVK